MNRTKAFVSYARQDERWKDILMQHMAPLENQGLINLWADTRIEIGADWRARIQHALDEAMVAILLVSPAFLSSEFILSVELPNLMKSHAELGMQILPVLVRPCAWKMVDWLARRQIRPKNGRAIGLVDPIRADADFTAICYEVAALITGMDSRLAAEEIAIAEAVSNRSFEAPIRYDFGSDSPRDPSAISIDAAFASIERVVSTARNTRGTRREDLISQIVREALKYGIPLYNQGSPLSCAIVYHHAAVSIRDVAVQSAAAAGSRTTRSDSPGRNEPEVEAALSSIPAIESITASNADSLAWQLRRILDVVSGA